MPKLKDSIEKMFLQTIFLKIFLNNDDILKAKLMNSDFKRTLSAHKILITEYHNRAKTLLKRILNFDMLTFLE